MKQHLSILSLLTISVLNWIPGICIGQTLKQYSGKFQGGSATYSYYETKSFDRKFHGPFDYNSGMFRMKGQHKYGLRTGIWVISASNITYSNGAETVLVNAMVTGNYKDGNLFGPWSYTNSMKLNHSKVADIEKSTANFIDNHFTDKFSYSANWPKNFTVNGQFDSFGIMDSKWIYTSGAVSDQIIYVKGIAAWRLTRNIETGEKLFYRDSLSFVERFWQNYEQETKISKIDDKRYTTDTVSIQRDIRISYDHDILKIRNYLSDGTREHPISLWFANSISLYNAGAVNNPLYLVRQGVKYPDGFEIIIVPCYGDDCSKR